MPVLFRKNDENKWLDVNPVEQQIFTLLVPSMPRKW
jgi:hypothetical protein